MFISIEQIRESLKYLEKVDSFSGITFLKFKQLQLPVGTTIKLSLYSEIKDFLERYYQPCKGSKFSYRCFRLSKNQDRWLNLDKYVKSIIKDIHITLFIEALISDKILEEEWGWKDKYIGFLKYLLYNKKLIPAFHLAVWLYREKEWSSETTPE
ncbi:MAG: hypothetical protein ACKO2Z_06020, partial [Sphaerospermopsis kisseleviana]